MSVVVAAWWVVVHQILVELKNLAEKVGGLDLPVFVAHEHVGGASGPSKLLPSDA